MPHFPDNPTNRSFSLCVPWETPPNLTWIIRGSDYRETWPWGCFHTEADAREMCERLNHASTLWRQYLNDRRALDGVDFDHELIEHAQDALGDHRWFKARGRVLYHVYILPAGTLRNVPTPANYTPPQT